MLVLKPWFNVQRRVANQHISTVIQTPHLYPLGNAHVKSPPGRYIRLGAHAQHQSGGSPTSWHEAMTLVATADGSTSYRISQLALQGPFAVPSPAQQRQNCMRTHARHDERSSVVKALAARAVTSQGSPFAMWSCLLHSPTLFSTGCLVWRYVQAMMAMMAKGPSRDAVRFQTAYSVVPL